MTNLHMTGVVTSFSAEGYEKYGKRFLDTFDLYWPKEVQVCVVSEDVLQLPLLVGTPRMVRFLPLLGSAPQDVLDFYTRHAGNTKVHGGVPDGKKKPYNFRFDAWKFSKKVFAINMAVEAMGVERLIWLDGDVVTLTDVDPEFVESMPPAGYALACLDRGVYHSECGFVAYDMRDAATRPFLQEFQRLYTSGEVFGLKEWHDSWVFDWLRRKTGISSYKIPHRHSGHPFVYSVLGRYMDHLKGSRKIKGASPDHPQREGKAPKPVKRWYGG